MKPTRGRPPTGLAKSSTQRSRECRARQRQRNLAALAALVQIINSNEKESGGAHGRCQ